MASSTMRIEIEAIHNANDEVFYATFPNARPSPRSAQVEAEHLRRFPLPPVDLSLVPLLLPEDDCPPLQLGMPVGTVGDEAVPQLAGVYAYHDPNSSYAYFPPQMPQQSIWTQVRRLFLGFSSVLMRGSSRRG